MCYVTFKFDFFSFKFSILSNFEVIDLGSIVFVEEIFISHIGCYIGPYVTCKYQCHSFSFWNYVKLFDPEVHDE